jgi:hypothetical protein
MGGVARPADTADGRTPRIGGHRGWADTADDSQDGNKSMRNLIMTAISVVLAA